MLLETFAKSPTVYGFSGRYYLVPLGIIIGMGLPVIHWLLLKPFPQLAKYPIVSRIYCTYLMCIIQ